MDSTGERLDWSLLTVSMTVEGNTPIGRVINWMDVISNTPAIIAHLRGLGNKTIEPVDNRYGICNDIRHRFGRDAEQAIIELFPYWPKFSGLANYPVPHYREWPTQAFNADVLWRDDRYGNDRRELCLCLAHQLEQLWRNGSCGLGVRR